MSLRLKIEHSRGDFNLSIDTEFAERGITAIYGPSGCGKTSLLRCIAGLEKVEQGEIRFAGVEWSNGQRNLPPEARGIGYVFQEASLFPHLNVRQNLNYGLNRIKSGTSRFELETVAELMGLTPMLERNSQLLSGGERQRVAIARAVLAHPKLLLMDEPLAALDNSSKQEILAYLEKLHQQLNIPVLYVTHAEEEIARLADNLAIMQAGRIVSHASLLQQLADLNSPLAQLDDCFGLIDSVVTQINQEFHLAQLAFDGLKLSLPCGDLRAGQKVRVRVLAKDISLCLAPPEQTSILNVLPAVITELKLDPNAQCLVTIKVGEFFLIARISEYSKVYLKLETGMRIFAQIKAMALI